MTSSKLFGSGILSIFMILLIGAPVQSQDFEEWRRQYLQEYQQFKDARDSLFTEMLNRHWEQFEAFKTGESYEDPKPEILPQAEPVDRPRVPTDFPEDEIPTIQFDLKEYEIDEPLERRPPPAPPAPPARSANMFEAGFYNHTMRVPLETDIRNMNVPAKFSRDEIAKFWETISQSDYEDLHKSFVEKREQFALNDWGYAKMVFQTASQIYNNDSMSNLFSWFFLSKAGYDCRVGYNDSGVYLMLPVRNTIFAASYFDINNERYYVVRFGDVAPQPGGLYSYDGKYPDADKQVSTFIPNIPKFDHDIVNRELSFTYKGETHTINVEVNRNLIAFYEYYPQTDFEVYFSAPVATETARSLLSQLRPIIQGKSETEAVNMLLRFVQTAFKYKIDPDNFGREKPLFPEETIYYEYSDCEDRAILFSFLVRNLTGLDVIGIHYPGHVATAVKFNVPVEGDTIQVNGQTYVISDPTYINADIGMEMPDFKGKKMTYIFPQ